MSRTSQAIEISKEDRERLEGMLGHTDTATEERIRIVLACAEEENNQKVARAQGVDGHTVAKWKEAYRKNGVEGLTRAKGSGRKANADLPDLEERILELVEEGSDWTIQSLAEEVGATYYQVRTVLQTKNITLGRKRQWTVTTRESCLTADIEMVGLYLSSEACAVLLCWNPYGIETEAGEYETRNRKLGERLERAEYPLSMGDLLVESLHSQQAVGTQRKLEEYLQESLTRLGEARGLTLQQFIWSREQFQYRGILPGYVKMEYSSSQDAWLRQIHSWAGGYTTAAHLYEIEVVLEGVKAYLESSESGMEPFCWWKRVKRIGTEKEPISYQPLQEIQPPVPLEEWIQQLIQGELEEDEIKAGFIAFVKDRNGFEYRTVLNRTPLPGADQFGFDSEEEFLNGMNQLETAIIKMRDEAGLTEADLYIEQVKKNANRSGS